MTRYCSRYAIIIILLVTHSYWRIIVILIHYYDIADSVYYCYSYSILNNEGNDSWPTFD